MAIRSRPATDEYREGWDRVFGKDCPECGMERREGERHFCVFPLNPHDAEDHPEAD